MRQMSIIARREPARSQQKHNAYVQDDIWASTTTPEPPARGLRQGVLQETEGYTAGGQQGGEDIPPTALCQGHV